MPALSPVNKLRSKTAAALAAAALALLAPALPVMTPTAAGAAAVTEQDIERARKGGPAEHYALALAYLADSANPRSVEQGRYWLYRAAFQSEDPKTRDKAHLKLAQINFAAGENRVTGAPDTSSPRGAATKETLTVGTPPSQRSADVREAAKPVDGAKITTGAATGGATADTAPASSTGTGTGGQQAKPAQTDGGADALRQIDEQRERDRARVRRFFAGFSGGAQLVDFWGRGASEACLYGGSVFGGLTLADETPVLRNMLLCVDAGFFTGSNSAGTIESEPYSPAGAFPDEPAYPTVAIDYSGYTDRVMRKARTVQMVPVTLSLTYRFQWKQVELRAGPIVGFTYATIKSVIAGGVYDRDGSLVGNVFSENSTASRILFTGGALLGGDLRLGNSFSLGLSYQFHYQTRFQTHAGDYRVNYGPALAHRFNLAATWRF
ncbi:MAG: hypothetical protein LBR07_08445 [Puniceicoccales bacterium]|jgi:hypothetical protein|nr:hypothetical protein [Puniceicoccales bacterium]